MTPPSDTQLPPVVRVLSESEIHERLYGSYFEKKNAPAPSSVPPPRPDRGGPTHSSPSPDSAWTGSEILTGELQRLRSELISLRQEKEQLVARLERAAHRPASLVRPEGHLPGQPGQVVRAVAISPSGVGTGGWLGKIFGFFLLLGIFGYLSGTVIQASPSAGDFTPYTVQVAVYNGPVLADRARGALKELGYDAFVAETPRADGKFRYRVYVGSFVTKEEAARESKRLEADPRFRDFKDTFVLIR